MSTFSDLKELYGGLENTWSRSQAHVFAHVVAGFAIFVWFGVTLPTFPLPQIDPAEISKSPWYEIAKDTGLIYVVLVIPLVILTAYAAFLRISGRLFQLVFTLLSNPDVSLFRGLSPADLEPLALTLNKDDEISLASLGEQFSKLVLKYQSTKPEPWLNVQKSLPAITQNSIQYFGDFCVVLLFWIIAFKLWPNSSWVEANTKHFWSVIWVLVLFIGLSWTRVLRATRVVPRLLLQVCSAIVQTDPEFSSLFVGNDERRERIRERLRDLLDQEQGRLRSRITLWYLVSRALGFSPPKESGRLLQSTFKWDVGLYERGKRMAQYDFSERPSLLDLVAYLYYRACDRISLLMKTIWGLLRYAFFGIP